MHALQDIPERQRAQYAAVVFNDSLVQRLTATNSTTNSSLGKLDFNLGSVLALVRAAAVASSLQGGINQAAIARLAARGAFMLSGEARVLRKMQARFNGPEFQAVSLMHNASAQHALPSLLSGGWLQQIVMI